MASFNDFSSLSKTEIYLPDTVPIEQARRTVEDDFNLGEDDKLIKMRLMWGLESISNHDESDWDSSKYGTLVWDEDFNLAPQANQQRILDICTAIRENELLLNNELDCFMETFRGKL